MLTDFLPLISIIFTIVFSYIYPYYKNLSIGDINTEYEFNASPSNWAFSIWFIIYTWLIGLSIYNIISDSFLYPIWTVLSFLLPSVWILTFINKELELAFVSLLLCVITSIITFFVSSDKKPPYLIINGLALYIGWLSTACILNLFIIIQRNLNEARISTDIMFILLLILIHILFVIIAPTEILRQGFAFSVVGLWSSIAVSTNYTYRFMIIAPIILIIVCLLAIYRMYTS
jgi:hypothetical protein